MTLVETKLIDTSHCHFRKETTGLDRSLRRTIILLLKKKSTTKENKTQLFKKKA